MSLPSLHGGSLKITLTVPLKRKKGLNRRAHENYRFIFLNNNKVLYILTNITSLIVYSYYTVSIYHYGYIPFL